MEVSPASARPGGRNRSQPGGPPVASFVEPPSETPPPPAPFPRMANCLEIGCLDLAKDPPQQPPQVSYLKGDTEGKLSPEETLHPVTTASRGRAQSDGLFLRVLTGAHTPSYSAGEHFISCLLLGEANLRQTAFLPQFSIKLFTHTYTPSLTLSKQGCRTLRKSAGTRQHSFFSKQSYSGDPFFFTCGS